MAQTILGIDLGSYSVKIAQLERSFGEFKLVNFFEVSLVAEEVLSDTEAACAALAKFLQENPISYDSCVLALPASMVAFRTLELPFANIKKIDQTLEFELETLVPFEIEELLFDYAIIHREENTSKVLATYLPEENFKNFLFQVQASGVDPRYVGVDVLGFSYLPNLNILPPIGRYAILDLGHHKTNLIVLEGNAVKMVRSLSWGGHGLTTAIARGLNLSFEEAEKRKITQAQLIQNPKKAIEKIILKEFEELSRQVKQTLFAFYETGESFIEAMYLTGGGARLTGVDAFFSRHHNINVSLLDVLDESYTQLDNSDNDRPVAATALSLALQGAFSNRGANINFRRGDYGYKKDVEELGGSLKKIGVMAAVVALIALINFIVSYVSLSGEADEMNQNIAKIVRRSVTDVPAKRIKDAKSALSLINGRMSSLEEKFKKIQGDTALSALEVFKKVSSAMPPRAQLQVDIDDLNVSPQRVRLEGRTGSYEAVDKIKSAMESVKEFKNVQTGNVRKGVREEIKFSLSFDIEENNG